MKGLRSESSESERCDEWHHAGSAAPERSEPVDRGAPNFSSFMMAGFECSYPLLADGTRMDLLAASRHDVHVENDYALLSELGIRTAREGFSWSQIDRGDGRYDLSRFEPILAAASHSGVQQIWDLNHFDFPSHLDPLSDAFVYAFAEYARRVVDALRGRSHETLYIVPMNEPSFFAWMSDCGLWAPFLRGESHLFKRQLVRAAIAAMDAIWEIDARVRFIHADPFMYRRPHRSTNLADVSYCETFNENVRFECWDMISGRIEPELGGDPKYLDIVGINYYFHNQQFVRVEPDREMAFKTIPLNDPQRLPLDEVIGQVQARYGRPVVVTETGSYRRRRPI